MEPRRPTEPWEGETAAWLRRWVAEHGFKLVGAVAAEEVATGRHWCAFRERNPWVRSLWLLLHVGDSVWRRLEPTEGGADPFDHYTQRCLDELAIELRKGGGRAVGFHAGTELVMELPLIHLLTLAGLARPSRLGLAIHPRFGTWIAVRGVLASDLAPPPPAALTDPCAGCPAPCATACTGEAFAAGAWDVAACVESRRRLESCRGRCAARLACPVGAEYRYGPEQAAYHRAVGNRYLFPEEVSGAEYERGA